MTGSQPCHKPLQLFKIQISSGSLPLICGGGGILKASEKNLRSSLMQVGSGSLP